MLDPSPPDIYETDGVAFRFRNELRDARYAAGRDSEGFQQIVFAIERLGRLSCPNARGLGQLRRVLSKLASKSTLAAPHLDATGIEQPSFETLFDLVLNGRNDALHQGAIARNLTRHAVELELILEDALVTTRRLVRDFMAGNPLCAELWEQIASIRRSMLVNQFSFVPFAHEDRWYLLSDEMLARYLAGDERRTRLAKSLGEALHANELVPSGAKQCFEDEFVEQVLSAEHGLPVLVFHRDPQKLVGILTAYDIL